LIKQIHLNQCDSTQDVLKEQLMKDPHTEGMIISCEHQLAGRGRGNNQWMSMPGTLCFSMNLKPHPILSFTAMEMAVIISHFFSLKGKELSLKWPNDLWDSQRKKCGGLLIQVHQEILLTGIGLNLFSEDKDFGGILDFDAEKIINKEMWSKEIGEFIVNNRIKDTPLLKTLWRQRCGHLNERVSIRDGEQEVQGIFQDIGEYGEALILTQDGVNKIYNGSLRFI
jgi:biotin-[acetyl-CoA-carboxylase] ligase BirA-like protein